MGAVYLRSSAGDTARSILAVWRRRRSGAATPPGVLRSLYVGDLLGILSGV